MTVDIKGKKCEVNTARHWEDMPEDFPRGTSEHVLSKELWGECMLPGPTTTSLESRPGGRGKNSQPLRGLYICGQLRYMVGTVISRRRWLQFSTTFWEGRYNDLPEVAPRLLSICTKIEHGTPILEVTQDLCWQCDGQSLHANVNNEIWLCINPSVLWISGVEIANKSTLHYINGHLTVTYGLDTSTTSTKIKCRPCSDCDCMFMAILTLSPTLQGRKSGRNWYTNPKKPALILATFSQPQRGPGASQSRSGRRDKGLQPIQYWFLQTLHAGFIWISPRCY